MRRFHIAIAVAACAGIMGSSAFAADSEAMNDAQFGCLTLSYWMGGFAGHQMGDADVKELITSTCHLPEGVYEQFDRVMQTGDVDTYRRYVGDRRGPMFKEYVKAAEVFFDHEAQEYTK